MPKRLPANWDAIAAISAGGTPLEEISKTTGININTLKARCRRGGWKDANKNTKALQVTTATKQGLMKPVAVNGPAMVSTIIKGRVGKAKLALSKYVRDASHTAATSKGSLTIAQDVKHVANIMQTLAPDGGAEDRVSLQFFAITMNTESEERVVDAIPA